MYLFFISCNYITFVFNNAITMTIKVFITTHELELVLSMLKKLTILHKGYEAFAI